MRRTAPLSSSLLSLGAAVVLLGAACGRDAASEPAPPAQASPAPAAPALAPAALRLGAPIEKDVREVALAEVARAPGSVGDARFATRGTVSAVCQHKGCWMEIKDAAGEAHVKMAGHAFFVPRTASGKRVKVSGTLVRAGDESGACEEANGKGGHGGHGGAGGCKAEAEQQLGRPLAKLELVADGVEIYD